MILFSEKTVRIFRVDDLRKKAELIHTLSECPSHKDDNIPNVITKSRSHTSLKDLEKRNRDVTRMQHAKFQTNGWHYMSVCFAKAPNALDYYNKVIKYMIEFTNISDLLKYNMTFQVVPIIIKHTYGNYYIVLRIRVYNELIPDIQNILTNVTTLFNTKHKSDMYMMPENETVNLKYIQWLYAKEYTPYFKNKNHSRSFGDLKDVSASSEEVRYATMSMEKEPPPPPMPKTLKLMPISMPIPISYDINNYINHFQVSRY